MRAWADIFNIAQVRFQDEKGLWRENQSNTITVTVLPPLTVQLSPPDLRGIDGQFFERTDPLQITYTAPYSEMEWAFEPLAGSNAPGPFSALSAPQTLIRTPSNSLSLSSLALSANRYRIAVRVWNSGQSSPWASAAITVGTRSLQTIKVFPNPWTQKDHSDIGITFSGLPVNSSLTLFSLDGRFVFKTDSPGATYTWNGRNTANENVASGLYFYVVQSQGQRARGKFVIIR